MYAEPASNSGREIYPPWLSRILIPVVMFFNETDEDSALVEQEYYLKHRDTEWELEKVKSLTKVSDDKYLIEIGEAKFLISEFDASFISKITGKGDIKQEKIIVSKETQNKLFTYI